MVGKCTCKRSYHSSIANSSGPTPQGQLLRTGVRRNARSTAHLQGGTGDVLQNGILCRGAQPERPHEEHLFPDGQRREMALVTGLQQGYAYNPDGQ